MFSKFLHTMPKSQLNWIFLAIYLLFFFTHVMHDLKVFADTVVSSILTKKKLYWVEEIKERIVYSHIYRYYYSLFLNISIF